MIKILKQLEFNLIYYKHLLQNWIGKDYSVVNILVIRNFITVKNVIQFKDIINVIQKCV